MKRIIFTPILALLSSTAFLTSCSEGRKPEASASLAPTELCLTDTLSNMVRIDTARLQQVTNQLQLVGRIALDEKKVFKVFPLVGGHVQSVKVELGDYVQKGQTLAVISSGEIAEFEQQRIASQSAQQVAQKNLEVAKDILTAGLISERELLAAQQEKKNADAEVQRLKQIYGIYSIGKGAEYVVKAPSAGFVVEKNINANMQIRSDNDTNIFTISSMNEIWVIANVFESDIFKIKEGYEAEVTTLSYPDKVFKGKTDRIFNVLDPETRTMKVRVRLDNPDFSLKPEMFANIRLQYPSDKQLLAVPSQSIVFDQSKNYVMVYRKRCDVEMREVHLYQTVGETTYLKSGLQEGESVISKYPLLVFNAAKSK
ncbi:efflux RND transporter periplasmic adaptor subunit [Rufibacter glacialis]|uniref:Efflux RND transporter periplasmic adaptor subunit n=1 Tax=Rufibacter glacialis TaxID=1259555 RepID=A0A5M8QIZ4_9BACT|nr:efflux RND transporter periplasmic adaptor subunit [Rufibacter glacialis]KAA6434733.1 efflux RND transporter periplasmic adaptor subunit [Rufibacter glacialis]GGK71986.1 RND transporter [Rufibacter glacialis]